MDHKAAIKTFIADELLEDEMPVEDDENLLADGMVDSLGMLRLVGFIEESFGIRVPPEDFIIDNFRTLNLLHSYLTRKLKAQSDHAG
ncbi:MAG: acyl carrier protein [Gammaproteobacteria bacterium]|nr:acyl carrier protein [Gammaproteobacteria bacterium]